MRKRKTFGKRALFYGCILVFFLFPKAGFSTSVTVYTESLAPVHYEEDGEVVGIATEIVRKIFDGAGLEPRFEMFPWKRAYQSVLSDRGSFIFTINRTEKREKLFQWIGPILPKKTSLYRLKHRQDIQLDDYDDIRKFTTVVILGHSLTQRLLDLGFREGHEIIITPNKAVQMRLFLTGRADLITGNQYTIYKSLKEFGLAINYVEPAFLVTTKGYYLAANIDTDADMVERLREANEKVQESGVVEKIIAKYMK